MDLIANLEEQKRSLTDKDYQAAKKEIERDLEFSEKQQEAIQKLTLEAMFLNALPAN